MDKYQGHFDISWPLLNCKRFRSCCGSVWQFCWRVLGGEIVTVVSVSASSMRCEGPTNCTLLRVMFSSQSVEPSRLYRRAAPFSLTGFPQQPSPLTWDSSALLWIVICVEFSLWCRSGRFIDDLKMCSLAIISILESEHMLAKQSRG